MGNCIVHKLGCEVNDPDLEIFDALQVRIVKGNFVNLVLNDNWVFGGPGVVLENIDNCVLPGGGETYTFGNTPGYNKAIALADESKDGELLVRGISKLRRFWGEFNDQFFVKDPERLKYLITHDESFPLTGRTSPVFMVLGNYPEIGSTEYGILINDIFDAHPELDKTSITEFRVCSENPSNTTRLSYLSEFTGLESFDINMRIVDGDLSEIQNLVNLTEIDLNKASITGDIVYLGGMTSLTYLKLNGTEYGTIEEFVGSQYDNGRTSETTGITLNFSDSTDITFGDEKVTSGTLTWTDRDTISIS